MNIGLMNKRIVIRKNIVIGDSIGNRKTSAVDYYTCFATVSGESGTEALAAGTTEDNSTADFTIRACTAVMAITPDDYFVCMDGELYNILTIDHQHYKNKSVKLKCRKVRR